MCQLICRWLVTSNFRAYRALGSCGNSAVFSAHSRFLKLLFVFATGSHYVSQNGLKLVISLPQSLTGIYHHAWLHFLEFSGIFCGWIWCGTCRWTGLTVCALFPRALGQNLLLCLHIFNICFLNISNYFMTILQHEEFSYVMRNRPWKGGLGKKICFGKYK